MVRSVSRETPECGLGWHSPCPQRGAAQAIAIRLEEPKSCPLAPARTPSPGSSSPRSCSPCRAARCSAAESDPISDYFVQTESEWHPCGSWRARPLCCRARQKGVLLWVRGHVSRETWPLFKRKALELSDVAQRPRPDLNPQRSLPPTRAGVSPGRSRRSAGVPWDRATPLTAATGGGPGDGR